MTTHYCSCKSLMDANPKSPWNATSTVILANFQGFSSLQCSLKVLSWSLKSSIVGFFLLFSAVYRAAQQNDSVSAREPASLRGGLWDKKMHSLIRHCHDSSLAMRPRPHVLLLSRVETVIYHVFRSLRMIRVEDFSRDNSAPMSAPPTQSGLRLRGSFPALALHKLYTIQDFYVKAKNFLLALIKHHNWWWCTFADNQLRPDFTLGANPNRSLYRSMSMTFS